MTEPETEPETEIGAPRGPGRARAHAKINPALSLAPPEPPGGPRAGWHRIATWMHAIDLADDLVLEPAEPGAGVTLHAMRAPDAPAEFEIDWPPEKDLAVRALRALAERAGRAIDARLTLVKRIPPQAGLGGGSSDAASALRLANRVFALGLSMDALRAVGLTLGSDVPFFLDDSPEGAPRPALVGGFGDEIERTPRVHAPLTLALPRFGCPTPEVYRAFDALGPTAIEAGRVAALARAGTIDGASLFNDLAPAAERVRPELAAIRARLAEASGAPAHVTGSGSALFVIGDHADRIRASLPEAAVFPARLL